MGLIKLGAAQAVADFVQSSSHTIITFSAHWSGPCKASKPALEDLAEEMCSRVKMGICYESDLGEAIQQTYHVCAFPTHIWFANGTETKRVEGANMSMVKALAEKSYECQVIRHKQQRLFLLRHALLCEHEPSMCPVTPHCATMKRLSEHISHCKKQTCEFQHCVSSREFLCHYRGCKDPLCSPCGPVRETFRREVQLENANGGGRSSSRNSFDNPSASALGCSLQRGSSNSSSAQYERNPKHPKTKAPVPALGYSGAMGPPAPVAFSTVCDDPAAALPLTEGETPKSSGGGTHSPATAHEASFERLGGSPPQAAAPASTHPFVHSENDAMSFADKRLSRTLSGSPINGRSNRQQIDTNGRSFVEGFKSLTQQAKVVLPIPFDGMVSMVDKIIGLRDEFLSTPGMTEVLVDIGYHYTTQWSLSHIMEIGLLSHIDREGKKIEAKTNGSKFGEGIYVSEDPVLCHKRGYGNCCIVVARLCGATSRWTKSNTDSRGTNSIEVHDGSGVRQFTVLKRSEQCVPLAYFHATAFDPSVDQHQGNQDVYEYHVQTQKLLDNFFNNGNVTAVPSEAVFFRRQPSAELENRDEKKRKERFLMLTKVLLKYLEQKDPSLHQTVKATIEECAERNRANAPGYESLTSAMNQRLRFVVSDAYWKKAEAYLDHFLKTREDKPQAAALAPTQGSNAEKLHDSTATAGAAGAAGSTPTAKPAVPPRTLSNKARSTTVQQPQDQIKGASSSPTKGLDAKRFPAPATTQENSIAFTSSVVGGLQNSVPISPDTAASKANLKTTNSFTFKTPCGHFGRIQPVCKIGGDYEGKWISFVSGPKTIAFQSGKKTVYSDAHIDAAKGRIARYLEIIPFSVDVTPCKSSDGCSNHATAVSDTNHVLSAKERAKLLHHATYQCVLRHLLDIVSAKDPVLGRKVFKMIEDCQERCDADKKRRFVRDVHRLVSTVTSNKDWETAQELAKRSKRGSKTRGIA